MNTEPKKALTMVEILIVVAIIALLAGGMFFVSGKANEYAKEQLIKSTLATLDTALQQYYDEYKVYPPDVNYANAGSRSLRDALSRTGNADPGPTIKPNPGGYSNDYVLVPNYDAQSIEVLYYYLNRVPQSRQVLSKLPDSAISDKAVKFDASGYPLASRVSDPNLVITIEGVQNIGFFRVVDSWNMPLQYVRARQPGFLNVVNTNFPLLRSAGPDRKFGTADDIVNRKN